MNFLRRYIFRRWWRAMCVRQERVCETQSMKGKTDES